MEPVKVIKGEVPLWQTEVVPLMIAVGKGLTVIVAVPVCVVTQAAVLAS